MSLDVFSRLIKMSINKIIVYTIVYFRFNGIKGIQRSSIL
jgi:hypothetical protein